MIFNPVIKGTAAVDVIKGEFTTIATSEATQTITIPYSGNGYPIAFMIFPSSGIFQPDSHCGTTIRRYSVVHFMVIKSFNGIIPTYNGNTDRQANIGYIYFAYKDSASDPIEYTQRAGYGYAFNQNLSSSLANYYYENSPIAMSNATTLKFKISGTSGTKYGLLPEENYVYCVVYSE